MKIAVVIPTRGIIFARTILSSILEPLLTGSHFIIVSGLPIPDSHNECVRRALATNCTHILFVEEDMEIPHDVLAALLREAETRPYVAVDYPVTKDTRTVVFRDNGKVLWTGFGCTIVNRNIFSQMIEPYFTDKIDIMIDQLHPFKYHTQSSNRNSYGKFDIEFGFHLQKLNIPMYVLPDVQCKHLRMKSWERKEVNNGTHEIYDL